MSNTTTASQLAIGDTFINPRDDEPVGPIEAIAEVEAVRPIRDGGLMDQIGGLPVRRVFRVPNRQHPVTLNADEPVTMA